MMVKLSFICNGSWYDNQANPIIRSVPYLLDNGYRIEIIVADNFEMRDSQVWPDIDKHIQYSRIDKLNDAVKLAIYQKPDIILCHHRCITAELLRSNIPIIIIEHTDAPALELSRYFIHLNNVVGVMKGTVFTDVDFYNGPFCEGMFHGSYINSINLPTSCPEFKLSTDDLSKIELGYSFGSFPKNVRFLNIDIDRERNIPISFVGSTYYKRSRLITLHRESAMDIVKQIGIGLSNVQINEFDRILLSSYVCLSPLGYGACYRSFEGLYCGCVVVQPNHFYVKSWPNIYVEGIHYIACNHDFSDIREITDDVINRWYEFDEKRHDSRKMLIDSYWDQEKLGTHLKEIFERCCKRIK